MKYQYLFGPVASRRLGLSLGIDLIPFKTCSFDCIYCECGGTTCLSTKRAEYIPTQKIQKELEIYFKEDYLKNKPDFFTFSGSGEPTLASNIGQVIQMIRSYESNSQIAVLTNSSLLWDKDVRKDILSVNLISPSLDCVLEESFQKINRPAPQITVSKIIEGLIRLRKEFKGQIWLEIFIVPEINTSEKELRTFKEAILEIKPDKIQLNSLDRPGVLKDIPKAPKALLEEIVNFWKLPGVEIIPNYQYANLSQSAESLDLRDQILQTIKRRPSTLADLSEATGKSKEEIAKLLHLLGEEKKVRTSILERGIFYSILES